MYPLKQPTEVVIYKTTHTAPYEGTKRLTATCQLRSIAGQPAYFSVTGEIYNPRKARSRDQGIEACGCLHDEILAVFPELAPLVALHLADAEGVPIHSVENGWYWAGGTHWNGEKEGNPPNAGFLASHLRISVDDASDMVDAVVGGVMSKDQFTVFVEGKKAGWKSEAERAITTLKSSADDIEARIAPEV